MVDKNIAAFLNDMYLTKQKIVGSGWNVDEYIESVREEELEYRKRPITENKNYRPKKKKSGSRGLNPFQVYNLIHRNKTTKSSTG